MDRNRLLELALEELPRRKAGIEAEIETLEAELKGTGSAARESRSVPSAGPRSRRKTPAERKAHSERMKRYWASKRVKSTKPASEPKPTPAGGVKEEKAKKSSAPQKKLAPKGDANKR